jgi:hypothetical protein
MPRGFGGGFRRGGFGRGGFGMGGMGMGGSPLLTGLMLGGLGYLLGSNTNQQVTPQVQQVAPAPTYQPPQVPQAAPASTSSADSGILAQLKLLGELHASGVLTDDEFTREKNRILGR